MLYDMNEDLLKRKIRICEELLKTADILEPGLSRLRGNIEHKIQINDARITDGIQNYYLVTGIVLYELHAPIMMLLQKSRPSSKKQLKHSIRRVISYLTEASEILKFESSSTMEGKIGFAAQQALLATGQWEKTLGKL